MTKLYGTIATPEYSGLHFTLENRSKLRLTCRGKDFVLPSSCRDLTGALLGSGTGKYCISFTQIARQYSGTYDCLIAVKSLDMPSVVLIETQSTCNRTCSFCDHGLRKVPSNSLDKQRIFALIDELSMLDYSGRLSLFGINEPMLDERMLSLHRYARLQLPKAYISLVTNGDVCDRGQLAEVAQYCDSVGISIYSASHKCQVVAKGLTEIANVRLLEHRVLENRAGAVPWLSVPDNLAKCLRPATMAVVKANGDIMACCSDFSGKLAIGNVQAGLVDALASQHRSHFGDRSNRICAECSYSGQAAQRNWP